ncbi:hypothetical protein MUG10_12765 [Xanthomonas prunicola]|uniref:Uncharacterized protein n=1 Tax=Xanthomonas prunicola TaxID=2053930 RepID=A0A9Q9MN85_9XANT|nr:hypothetical protein [Xanthomonas prunicola]USI98983.1 hypothetical protein MUG10_12765 [Xanthomonas prunicola]UXA47400.1 hypothetical protein M0D44_13610 [Xanthomonas prunicola]UXA54746.1 hypothetical protein M0D45_08565 [Xanthomonas prunicola]UXA55860.1 hypothetical protein M0D47_13550 [Xanthomonas prunicola]UXA61818.1 hypothetical protein M0D48_01940 [Xanthomonas prunicola]
MSTKCVSSSLVIALAGVLALSGCSKKTDDSVSKDPTSGAPTEAMPGPAATPPASDQAGQSSTTGAASTDGGAAMGGAVTVSSVVVGTKAAADKTVTPSSNVGTKDTIIVSVKTDGSASNVAVSAKLTYQDGQVAGEQNATLNTTGADTTNLSFSKPDGWPAGTYTAQVMVDGKPAGNPQTITVK